MNETQIIELIRELGISAIAVYYMYSINEKIHELITHLKQRPCIMNHNE